MKSAFETLAAKTFVCTKTFGRAPEIQRALGLCIYAIKPSTKLCRKTWRSKPARYFIESLWKVSCSIGR